MKGFDVGYLYPTVGPEKYKYIGLTLKAWCYEACICDYEKAYNIWLELANLYKNDGLEIEAEITRENADRVKAKMS